MKNSGRALLIATIIIFSHSLFAQTNTEKLQQLLVDAYAAIEMHHPLDKQAWCNKVRELIKDELDRVDPHLVGPGEFNVMHYAAGFGDSDLVDALFEIDPTLLLGNTLGVTPLHVAAGEDQVDAVVKLTRHGANCNAQGIHGATPLHVAAYCNHVQAMIVLLTAGANLEATTSKGHTPLHSATSHMSVTAMATLLQHGANPNALTLARNTPLELAKRNRQLSAVVLLIAHGAQVPDNFIFTHVSLRFCVTDLEFSRLRTVHERFEMLSTCAIEAYDVALVQAILIAQSLPNETLFHTAVRLGRADLLQLVLNKSSQETLAELINHPNAIGATALSQALQNGQYGEADQLLSFGASPLLGNPSSLTLAHILASNWIEKVREQGVVAIVRRVGPLKELLPDADIFKHILLLMWRMHLPTYGVGVAYEKTRKL